MKEIKKLLLIFVCTILIFAPCYVYATEEENNSEGLGTTQTPTPSESPTPSPSSSPSPSPEPSEEPVNYTISLNKTELILDSEKSETLIATTNPAEAEVKWTIVAQNEGASINTTIDQSGKITAGNTAETVIVTATIKGTDVKASCTVKVTRTIGKDATLKDLKIINGTLEPEFKSDIDKYKVIVDSVVSSLKIEYKLSDSHAKYFGPSSSDNKNLKNNDTLEIKIVADDGTTNKTYTLTIVKDETSLNLKKLEINGYALNESFDPELLEYTASIPYEIETISILANPVDSSVTVKPSGLTNLKVGTNTVKITVTDKDGNSKIYKIIVTREKEVSIEEKPTSIITSDNITDNNQTSSDSTIIFQNNSNSDNILKYAIVSVACFILFAIGGIGIYFFMKTSPKKLRKQLQETKKKVDNSPITEVQSTNNQSTSIQQSSIMESMEKNLIETKEFEILESENNEGIDDVFNDRKDV